MAEQGFPATHLLEGKGDAGRGAHNGLVEDLKIPGPRGHQGESLECSVVSELVAEEGFPSAHHPFNTRKKCLSELMLYCP